MVIVGNEERSSGGSMCIAPGAKADDGELNVTIMLSDSRSRMIFRLMPEIPTDGNIQQPVVRYFTAKSLEGTSDLFGTMPAIIRVYPRVLEVMSSI